MTDMPRRDGSRHPADRSDGGDGPRHDTMDDMAPDLAPSDHALLSMISWDSSASRSLPPRTSPDGASPIGSPAGTSPAGAPSTGSASEALPSVSAPADSPSTSPDEATPDAVPSAVSPDAAPSAVAGERPDASPTTPTSPTTPPVRPTSRPASRPASAMAPSHPARGTAAQAIMDLLLRRGEATQGEMRDVLGLSMPTVTANLRTLRDEGLVVPASLRRSTGGRQPRAWGLRRGARTAIGVGIRTGGVTMVAADLTGRAIARESRALPFRDNDAYSSHLDLTIERFAARVAGRASAPTGVSFAVPGVVSEEGTAVVLPEPEGPAPVTLDRLAKGLTMPASLIRCAAARAVAESWADRTVDDAACLYLDLHPTGALLMSGRLREGRAHADGVLEHLPVDPSGPLCHCGRRGCMGAVCSPAVLMEDGESLSGFFSVLEQGERGHRRRFERWLDGVARAVVTVRSVIAGDVVLGGEAARYLDDADLAALRTRIVDLSPFPPCRLALRTSCDAPDQEALGAALDLLTAETDVLRGLAAPGR